MDARSKVVDSAHQVKAQPFGVTEKSRVRDFSSSKEDVCFFEWDIQITGKLAHVLGNKHGVNVVFGIAVDKRDTDIPAGENFGGEFADHRGQLHGEQTPGNFFHRGSHLTERLGEFFWRTGFHHV